MLSQGLGRKVVLTVVSLVIIGAFIFTGRTIGYTLPSVNTVNKLDSLRTQSTAKDGGRLDEIQSTMWENGFASPQGVNLAHDKIFKIEAAKAFSEGRAVNIFGRDSKMSFAADADEFIKKSGEVGVSAQDVSKKLVQAHGFLSQVFDNDFINEVVFEIAKIDEAKVEKDVEKGLAKKSALDFLRLVKKIAANQDLPERNKQAREAIVDDTRFIAFLFGEKGLSPHLFNVGNILSREHRSLVAHIGTHPYEGSEGIEGGPRTIYASLARISGFVEKVGKQGDILTYVDAYQTMMLHEFIDLASGKHVPVSKKVAAKVNKINSAIDKQYHEVDQAIVTEITEAGPVLVSNDRVTVEKYRLINDLGVKDSFAIKGSSKVHPGVPKGQLLTITIAKADTGSTGGHGTAPGKMLEAVAEEWMKAAERGEIVDFFITRVGDDISVIVTHDKGKDSELIHKHIWDGFMRSSVVAKDLGYYGAGQDMLAEAFSGNVRGAGPSVAEMVIKEQASEVVIFGQADKTAPGAFNRGLWNILFSPDTTWRPLGPGEAENIQVGMLDFDFNNNAGRHIWLTKKDYDDAYWYGGYPDRYTYDLAKLGNGEEFAAVTAQRLGIIAGEYVGKDDPMFMIRSQKKFPAVGEITSAFLKGEYIVPGWMRGSNKGPFFPVALTEAKIGIYDGPPLLGMWSFNLNHGRLEGFYDLMGANPAIRYIQDRRAAAAVRQLEEGFHEMGLRLGPEEIEYQKGPTLIENRLKDRWEVYEEKKDGGKTAQEEVDKATESVARYIALTKTQDVQKNHLEMTWGSRLAKFAEVFPFDINQGLSTKLIDIHKDEKGKAYPIVISYEALLKKSPEGIMGFRNIVQQLGEGNIKFVLHINRDDIKAEELDQVIEESIDQINKINGGYVDINKTMFSAVVVGTNPEDVANQVKDKVGADIFQVIGSQEYAAQFKNVIKVVINPAAKGELTSVSKALKLGLELISTEGKISKEDLSKLDALFSQDEDGTFHVASSKVITTVSEEADKYAKEVEAKVRI